MRQTELTLEARDREKLGLFRSRGMHHSREVNRAHILMALDQKIPESMIQRILGVGRTAIWRTRSAYCEKGLEHALRDAPRSGAPPEYQTDHEAKVVALACSQPPAGARRWTLQLLAQAAHRESGMKHISRESIRRFLKKTSVSPGAK